MLKFKIVVVGRTRAGFLKEGENFYLKRLSGYAQVEWVEVRPVPIRKGRENEEVLALEGDAIRKALSPKEYVVTLDRAGKPLDSEEMAAWIERMSLSQSRLTFVIGGPLGISKDLLNMSNERISLSRLTLTHEMSRLILLEQLYRACTILRGEKYHK